MSSPTRRRIYEAAWNLIVVRGEAGFTMAQIAKKAKISRQALYLHFADRAQLLDALVRYADEKRGLASAIQHIVEAPTAREALDRMVSLQALQNPRIWAIALAFEAVRRTDKAAQRSWQARQTRRLETCRTIIERLRREGELRPTLTMEEAADLLYVITSLRMWEDLVLVRGWTADNYEERVTRLLTEALTISGERGLSIGGGGIRREVSTTRPERALERVTFSSDTARAPAASRGKQAKPATKSAPR